MDSSRLSYSHFILVNSIGRGGAERQISYLAPIPEIEKIICIEPLTEYPIPSNKQVILTSHFSEKNRWQKIKQLLFVPSKIKQLVGKKSHLICFLQISNIIGYLVQVINGSMFTISVRSNPWGYYQNSPTLKLPFFLYKFLLQKANFVITNSTETAIQLNEKIKLKNPALAINNGYDISLIDKMAEEEIEIWNPVFENNKVLITVGRLYEDKGHWHLIRVFSALKKNNPSLRLMILGRGPLLQPLLNLCTSFGLRSYSYEKPETLTYTEDVYFLGFSNNPYALLKKSYLFLFTSLFEGLPNSPIESLICNLPVIMSDCPTGPSEILFPEGKEETNAQGFSISRYGLLIPPFSGETNYTTDALNEIEQYWVNAVEWYSMNNDAFIKQKQACSEIRQRYALETTLNQWRNFLIQVEKAG